MLTPHRLTSLRYGLTLSIHGCLSESYIQRLQRCLDGYTYMVSWYQSPPWGPVGLSCLVGS